MADDIDSDSEVEFPLSRKRKLGVINVSEDSQSDDDDDDDEEEEEEDEDDEDMDSEGEEDEDESDEDESADDDDDVVNDVDLADDVNSDQCSICLMEFTDQVLGIPDSCAHVFCSVCIQEWAKNINTCPVDRKVFHVIVTRKSQDGAQIDQIKVEDRTVIKDEYEDPTSCEVCGVGDREERMLLCDGCDRGFHLECLTPPLDSVPDGEWFCPDCSSTYMHNTRGRHSNAIGMDNEMAAVSMEPETSSAVDQRAPRSRTSSSSRRRARTVATTRRRRRTRGQTGTRQTRRRAQRGKSSSRRGGTSSRGASSTSRGKQKSKKKRRKRRRKRKSRKAKEKSTGKSESKRARIDAPPSRYLLPHEMEPSASFSLFGSDFDLAYLPCVESLTRVETPKAEPQRSSADLNPDVLGSIFSGLDTLHHKDLTVDATGRVKVSEDAENRANAESTADLSGTSFKQDNSPGGINADVTAKPSCKEVNPSNADSNKMGEQNTDEQHTKPGVKRITWDFLGIRDRDDDTSDAKNVSPDINEKRIKRFDRPRSVSSKLEYQGSQGANILELARKSRTHRHGSYGAKDPKYGQGNYTSKRAEANALVTYKIPRKKPVSKDLPEASVPSVEVASESKCKAVQNTIARSSGYKDVGLPRPVQLDVMNLPTRVKSCTQQRVSEGRTMTENRSSLPARICQDSLSVNKCSITPRTTPSIGSSVGLDFTAYVRGVSDVQETTSNMVRVDQKPVVSPAIANPSERKDLASVKSGVCTRVENPSFKSPDPSAACFTKILSGISDRSTAPDYSSRQTATNRDIIYMINRKKSALSDTDSDNTESSRSSVRESTAKRVLTNPIRNSKGLPGKLAKVIKVLPPLVPVVISSRPIAVVRPTTAQESQGVVSRETSNDNDAARRRMKGIERLQRNQTISDEVKESLKPFYLYKEINKEQYKYIYKRAAEKIKQSCLPVESRSVSTLVRNYVKKVKGNQVKLSGEL